MTKLTKRLRFPHLKIHDPKYIIRSRRGKLITISDSLKSAIRIASLHGYGNNVVYKRTKKGEVFQYSD